jgi:hypothetical protein
MSDVTSDYRTLVKSKHYIDLPGESPKSKLWPGVNNLIILRKHRDVVFDVKLGNGATYTVTTDRPQSEYGRFYDPKRNLNVTKVTFQDGEPCHIWLGRTFEGSLILKQGDKVLGCYPIRKMDCTQGCTEDPKDKPVPMLIILHEDKEFAKELVALATEPAMTLQPVAPALSAALRKAQGSAPVSQGGPFPPLQASTANKESDVMPMIHAFSIKQTSGLGVPPELEEVFEDGSKIFKNGSNTYSWDPSGALSRNFLLAQVGAGLAYLGDAQPLLKKFWRRAFIIQRNAKGEFTLLFSTSTKERELVGYLLGVYQTGSRDIRVMTLAGGVGSLAAAGRAAVDNANASVSLKTWTGKAMGLAIAMDTAAWFYDYHYHPDNQQPKDIADLLALLAVDTVMMWVGGALTELALAGLFAGAAFFLGSGAATIAVIAAGTVVIIVGINILLTAAANKTNANNHVADGIRWVGRLLEKQLPRDYGDAYSQSTWEMFPMGATP